MIDAIIFDVDGTLWDSTPIVEKAWNKALVDFGINDVHISADTLKGLFGLPMDEIIDNILPNEPVKRRRDFRPLCFSYEHEYLERESGLVYEGLEQALITLSKKMPLFIVSNCQAGYIELFYKKTGLGKYFKDHLCPGDTGMFKADNILKIVNDYGLKDPVYLGDTHMDEDACRAAKVKFAFAKYGFGHALNPDYVVENLKELEQLFG